MRRSALTTLIGTATLAVLLAAGTAGAAEKQKVLGLAITAWRTALYETKDGKEECPDGFAISSDDIYLNSLTPAARAKLTLNGTIESIDPRIRHIVANRGPKGEDVCYYPNSVKDPVMPTVKGRIGFGLDLDGADGKATAKTCQHEEFTSPDGARGIDNQWYRLVGCSQGWRDEGYMEGNANIELKDGGSAILVRITADDLTNASEAQVEFFVARDPMTKDTAGNVIPAGSYRVFDNFHLKTTGRIENGVLTTAPIDARFPYYANGLDFDRLIKDMRLRFELLPDGRGAKGMVAGYYDLDSFHDFLKYDGYLTKVGHFSCPAMWEAANRLADGHPDAQGRCSSLSSAFHVDAVSAFVIAPETAVQSAADQRNAAPIRAAQQ